MCIEKAWTGGEIVHFDLSVYKVVCSFVCSSTAISCPLLILKTKYFI